MGAAGTAVVVEMIKGMGRGWCFSFIAAVVFLASGILWVEERWGMGWREGRRVRVEREREREKKEEEEERRGPTAVDDLSDVVEKERS